MGLLKKLTKPLSKFLDKIVPNELKPALPYLAAFAPYMSGMQGIMGSGMLQRALMSGGLNIGAQLAQEGSEGEFSGLSALLAAGQGAMTAPGAADTLRGIRPGTPGVPDMIGMPAASQAAPEGFIGTGREWLAKGADFLEPGIDILSKGGAKPGFDMATLKAVGLPLSHGTGDLAMADARRATRDYERQMAADEADSLIDDKGRRRAIRSAMEAGGHAEEAILDALASLGLRSGGIVSLRDGGQLVKRGPGRPGYGGPHETAAAGRSYAAATSPGGGGAENWQRQALKDFSKLSSTKSGGTGTGTGTGTTTPIEEIIKTKTINEPIGILANIKNMFRRKNPEDVDLGVANIVGVDAEKAKNQIIANKNLIASQTTDKPGFDPNDPNTWEFRSGGRVGLLRGGDPNDYSQQEDVGILELQKEEGVPIGPMVKNEFESDMLSALKQAYDEAVKKGYKGSFRQFIQEQGSGIKAAQGGMMSVLPRGKEMDYRGGGVIPMGSKERADDVPARLSKNEFVMTADAVKAAGGGSVNRGAKKMYNLMHNLEARV